MKFIKVKLKDICTPKQWKSLPISALHENGKYKVYGANGVIGYYNEYNHKFPTLAIACRGSCGQISLTEPKSYITSNAMSLDDLDVSKVDLKFLKYALQKRGFNDVITGAVQPQITATNLNKIDLLIPEKLEDQQKIAQQLSQIEVLINKREESIKLLDELTKSTFLDMFGDPGINRKKFPIKKFGEHIDYIGDIGSNGSNANISANLEMLDTEDYAIMIRTVNLNANDFKNNIKYVSKKTYDYFKKSKINGGEIIMNKIGSAGKIWIMPYLNRPVSLGLNQLMIRLKELNTNYLYYLLSTNYGQMIINSKVNGAVTKSITKGAVKELPLLYPPIELQNKFAEIVTQIENIKTIYQNSLTELNNLFGSIAQKAFKGELDVSKIELIQKKQEEITMAIKLDENKLIEEIKKGDFEASKYVNEHQNYDAIKDMVFKLLEDGKLSQKFDAISKKIILEVK